MADEKELEPTEEEQTEAEVQAELDSLARQLKGEPEPEAPEAPVTDEAPVEDVVSGDDDDGLTDAAISHIARLPRDKQLEHLQRLGIDATPRKQIEQDEVKVAEAVKKVTAREMLDSLISQVPDEELPDGFDDMEPHEQNAILVAIASEKRAKNIAEEQLRPFMEQQAQAQHQQLIDATSSQWAQELGVPDAATPIKEFLAKFSPQEVELYKQQAQAGGGSFVEMVHGNVQNIASGLQKQSEQQKEVPLPGAEETGGATKVDEPNLSGPAAQMYEQMKSSGQLSADELKAVRQEMSAI